MNPSYRGFIERVGSKLTLFTSTFNAENFMCRLLWPIVRDVGAI